MEGRGIGYVERIRKQSFPDYVTIPDEPIPVNLRDF